ncbi:amino acid racemase [Bacillus sp. DX1.1]|uniref:aspartate/glutamate racemase family protein n=1 Tax=unclassified Bacillus (in: firmicutes) TaxID=185979 RepID=UPI002570E497|nr:MULTISPECIES: amino acid racemase [unclassified Bacillus (in: firmicutes)]MDM5156919.1 amino acid racemase [Bacillus sp. DX1.1]WJE81162.1 amino acid racemase [Bacillus sp. DX3.1]
MIGILAGMGPKSTGPFVDTVIEQCQEIYGAKDDMDFPHMMIYSCPTPFYMDRPINHEDMEKAIIHGAQKLESTGINFIAIPCNTAHLYFNQVKNSVSVPLLNMVDETIKEIPNHAKRVALLATDATVQSGMYQEAFSKSGMNYIYKDSWQTDVNIIISKIKIGQINESSQLWNKLCTELATTVDVVIIACTDLNVVLDKKSDNICFVDSSTCLARAVVKKYLSIRESITEM